MTRFIVAVLGAIGWVGVMGCESTGGHCGPGKPPPDGRPRIRAISLYVTHEVTESAKERDPVTGSYAGEDKTEGGSKPGDSLVTDEEVLKDEYKVYRVRASYTQQHPGGLALCCRFETLVGPAPSFNTSPRARACFHSSALTVHVDRGWAYVSGDMPYTDTGVVRTSTFGSYAFGEWITHELPGQQQHLVYNLGKGSTSVLRFWINDVLQSEPIGPGQKLEYDRASGLSRITPYDPNESFLLEVKKIAAAAGVTISP